MREDEKKYKGQTSGKFKELTDEQRREYAKNWAKYNSKRTKNNNQEKK